MSQINLDEWYTIDQAVERLSANSGRPINRDYPRTLAKYKKVRTLELGSRAQLYYKADIDAIVVDTRRGRKSQRADG